MPSGAVSVKRLAQSGRLLIDLFAPLRYRGGKKFVALTLGLTLIGRLGIVMESGDLSKVFSVHAAKTQNGRENLDEGR